jgi:hypothetical protein
MKKTVEEEREVDFNDAIELVELEVLNIFAEMLVTLIDHNQNPVLDIWKNGPTYTPLRALLLFAQNVSYGHGVWTYDDVDNLIKEGTIDYILVFYDDQKSGKLQAKDRVGYMGNPLCRDYRRICHVSDIVRLEGDCAEGARRYEEFDHILTENNLKLALQKRKLMDLRGNL